MTRAEQVLVALAAAKARLRDVVVDRPGDPEAVAAAELVVDDAVLTCLVEGRQLLLAEQDRIRTMSSELRGSLGAAIEESASQRGGGR